MIINKSRRGQKYKMYGLMLLICFPFCGWGQVRIAAEVNSNSKERLYLAVYSENDEQLHPVFNGKIKIDVQQYEEYILAFFQKKGLPQFISVHSNASRPDLKIQLDLPKGNPKEEDYVPRWRYAASGKTGFDLDQIQDKAAFGFQMGRAVDAIRDYYKNGQLPRIKNIRKTAISLESIKKTEHKLGQELYILLQRKQWLEKHLDDINKLIAPSQKISEEQFCLDELKYLKIETQLVQTQFQMAEKELERVKLRNNKAIKTGKAPSKKALTKAQTAYDNLTQQQAIAALNLKNKQADCWAMRKQKALASSNQLSDSERQIKQLAISNIRLKQQQDNAVDLYKKHNALASTLTGRERVVALANAQKSAYDQAITKVYQSQNNLRKWQLKDAGTGQYASDIKRSSQLLQKRRDMAWEAEFSYLEHLWHLRDKSKLEARVAEDLYERQSGLLRIAPPPQWALPEADASDEEILAKAAIVTEVQEGDEIIRKVQFPDDYYEIIINSKKVKRYTKNQKPITAITYRFETIKKFGAYLNNIRVEESRKSWLIELFKKRIF